jgi:predicted PurR-regulated permease PerM
LAIDIFFVAFFATFGSLMFSQLADAVAAAPDMITNVTNWLNASFDLKLNATEIIKSLNLETSTITPVVTNLAGGLIGVLSSLMTAIFELATVLVFAFYFSADAHKVKRGIASWLPADRQRVFLTVWEIAVSKTGGFVVSRVVLAAISAVVHSIFYFAIGLPYWLPMGIFAGISAQFVPSVGTYLGIIVPVLFSIGNDTTDIIWIVAFATVYQQIETYVLTPRVSRATMDLHPAVAMASAFFGVALLGPVGAFIGMPILAGIIAVIGTYGQRHELIADLDPNE